MAGSFARYVLRSGEGSLVSNWLKRSTPHPDAFPCGVRVLAGGLAGEGPRWRYRSSAVDRLMQNGVRTLNHGPVVLRVAVEPASVSPGRGSGVRPGNVVITAIEQSSGARLELAFPAVELARFGIVE